MTTINEEIAGLPARCAGRLFRSLDDEVRRQPGSVVGRRSTVWDIEMAGTDMCLQGEAFTCLMRWHRG